MAKAVIKTRDGQSFTIVPSDPFHVNYDAAKHGEELSSGSNTRRRNGFQSAIDGAIRGLRNVIRLEVVAADEKTAAVYANVETVDHVLAASDAHGNSVLINGVDIVSVVISD